MELHTKKKATQKKFAKIANQWIKNKKPTTKQKNINFKYKIQDKGLIRITKRNESGVERRQQKWPSNMKCRRQDSKKKIARKEWNEMENMLHDLILTSKFDTFSGP